jgi:PDZ domain-containing secreted protein
LAEDSKPIPDPTLLTTQQLYREIIHVREIMDEREKANEQRWVDNKLAVDAALNAAKEAVGKSEGSQVKSMDELQNLVSSQKSGTDQRIDELRARVDKSEGVVGGQREEKHSGQNMLNLVLGFLTMLAVSVAAVAAVVALSQQRH